jgi:hypothetical protein
MPNVNRQNLEALRNMVSQAHLIVSSGPMIAGGIERARELLDTAERLADFLLNGFPRNDSARPAPLRTTKIGRTELARYSPITPRFPLDSRS